MSFFKTISTCFYLGYIPFIPGTIGSLAGIFLYWFVLSKNIFLYSAVTVVLIFSGFYICTMAENEFKTKDDKKIILDEIIGIFISMLFIKKTIPAVIVGFLLFRFFDVSKILFINKIQKLNGGIGIVLDDVLAGIYTNIFLSFLF